MTTENSTFLVRNGTILTGTQKIVVWYLLIVGGLNFVWMLLFVFLNPPGTAYPVFRLMISAGLDVCFIFAGLMLLMKSIAAVAVATISIILNAVYATFGFTEGYVHSGTRAGPAIGPFLVLGILALLGWNFLLVGLLRRRPFSP